MLAFECLVEVELRAAHDDFVAVRDVVLEALLQRQDLRHQLPRVRIRHERQHDDAERRLHRRMLVQLVQHHAGNRIAFEFDYDADTITIGFVAQRTDARELTVADELRNVDDEILRIGLIRHFSDDDLRLAARFLLFDDGARTHHDAAAPRILIIRNAGAAVDVATGRKIGALYERA